MKKNNKRIYWIRHGESFSNTSELNHNIIDPCLTTNGINQCNDLKKKIKFDGLDNKIDLIVISPLTRSIETCINVFDDFIYKVKFICLEEIREHIDKPCHKRKKKNELIDKYKYIDFSHLKYNNDYLYEQYNGNEPDIQVIKRCEKFISWLKSRNETNIVVITHGNFLFPLFNNILNNIPNKSFFSNCELRIFELET